MNCGVLILAVLNMITADAVGSDEADAGLQYGVPRAAGLFALAIGLLDGLAYGPEGALVHDHFLVGLLYLAQLAEYTTEQDDQHHHGGELHAPLIQRQVDANGDDHGKQRGLDGAERGLAEHLFLQCTVELRCFGVEDGAGQLLARHRLQRLDRLQGIGQPHQQGFR